MKSTLQLPVWREVDVLVVGASAGAVAAALEIRARGRTALAVSDLSYFGEESAGTLNLWPSGLDRTDALVGAMFPGAAAEPSRPAAVKRALESALVRASVPFLYLARPVALLRNEAGGLIGAIIAARTSLFVVRCTAIVDATRHGGIARLEGVALKPRPDLPGTLSWTVFSRGAPEGWEGRAEALGLAFPQGLAEGETTVDAYRLRLDRAACGNDPVTWEHRVRASLVAANVRVTADVVVDVPAGMCAASTSLSDDPAALGDPAFAAAPGLFLLNGLLPLTSHGVGALERSDALVALGRRVGVLAAASARSGQAKARGPVQALTGGDVGGDFRFAPAFLRQDDGLLDISPLAFPRLGRCDVVVAGGGTGGAPAGIAAARAGVSTVVLEVQHGLGGVGTTGLIAAYWYGNRVGFTAELDAEVRRIEPADWIRNGDMWRPEVKAGVYHRWLRDAGGAAWLGSYTCGVRLSGRQVDGVLVSTPFGCGLLETGCVVDATGNADIAAAAGAPCRVMGADHLATQGTGLSPRVRPDLRCSSNSDWTFVDETDPEGITAAFVQARAKFTEAFDTSLMVNSRERRQIVGELEVSPLDILAHRTFPDTVVVASSNFDTHGFIVHSVFMVSEPSGDYSSLQAEVPFRCMLPQGIDGVVVTGLGMSAHRDALPVLRMQADVQNQGYAAGVAAAWSSKGSRRLRDVDIRKLQHRLVEVGILTSEVVGRGDSFPLSDQSIKDAAGGSLRSPLQAAICFANPEKSRPLLRRRLEQGADAEGRVDAALILGLMGFLEAAPVLAEAVSGCAWDDGWNFTGMGQNGPSMSRLDALVLALARTSDALAIAPIEKKIRDLDEHSAFSHCRFVAIAVALLRDPRLTRALAALARRPGIRGHALCALGDMMAQANNDPVETAARNVSLRELYLARGLHLAGDDEGLGRSMLEAYTHDLRGHYARFARAVLEQAMTDDVRMALT